MFVTRNIACLACVLLAGFATATPASNLDCLTCHATMAGETLVMQHIAAEETVSCTGCHGASKAHVTDGTGAAKPDKLFGRTEVEAMCSECHGGHEDAQAVERFRAEWGGQRRGHGPVVSDAAICTDCHGEHWGDVKDDVRPWTALFNGENLTGWRAEGNASWTVRDGCLVGRQGEGNAPGDLFTEKTFANFELVVTFKVIWPANTGVWFRYQSASTAYQADVLEWKNPVCWAGTLYCPGKMFLSMNEDEQLVRKDDWNVFHIRAEGDHITINLNGTLVSDVHDGSSDHGSVGFQVHAGDQFADMEVSVREVLVRPLP